jgi:uracil-DNA glycosylase
VRLVAWREQVAREKRRAYATEDYWGRPVPGFGDPAARLLIVGLAPGAHGANRTGRIFTGDRSGDVLYASLHRCGLASQPTLARRATTGCGSTGAWITTPGPLRTTERTGRRSQERDACAPFLARGAPARCRGARRSRSAPSPGMRSCAPRRGSEGRARPRFGHGAEVPALADGRMLIGSYHVSQQNTFTGRLTPDMLDAVVLEAMRLAGLALRTEPSAQATP